MTAGTANPISEQTVNLAQYPIHALSTERGQTLIKTCRELLARDGCCTLENFIKPAAVAEMIRLAGELEEQAWPSDRQHTIYFEPRDKGVPAEHPRAHLERSAKHGIAYDRIPKDAPLRRLYESDDLTRFIAAVLEKPLLYRSADPLDAFQITSFYPGEELGWHFDNSEFSITIMYQPAEHGGVFEYVPRLRSAGDENYAAVGEVLQGRSSQVKVQPGAPGTLAFFHGKHALHRVTRVQGNRPRINSVLTYGERPDMRLSDLTSELFYGRTSPRYATPKTAPAAANQR